MSRFDDLIDRAWNGGRLLALRTVCLHMVTRYHPRAARSLAPAILSSRARDRLLAWITKAGRMRRAAFVRMVRRDSRPRKGQTRRSGRAARITKRMPTPARRGKTGERR